MNACFAERAANNGKSRFGRLYSFAHERTGIDSPTGQPTNDAHISIPFGDHVDFTDFRPEMLVRLGIDQLRGDADALPAARTLPSSTVPTFRSLAICSSFDPRKRS